MVFPFLFLRQFTFRNLQKMKVLLSITYLLLSCIGSAQNLADRYNQVKSSVVVIDILSLEPKTAGNTMAFVAKSQQGSGVLISENGLIWTASHVVQSAELVRVEFLDGDIYDAEVLASNPLADVALIKIKDQFSLKNKKVAEIGDSNSLQIGEDVFVIGAPFGLKQSVTKGILSGRHFPESLSNDFSNIEFLQTDAAINHGNSGGPVFNMKGKVMGITSSIYSAYGGFTGIGFAASSNTAKKLLMEEPTIWTGMESVIVTGNIAKALNIPRASGLLVLRLSSKGAANKIGLKGGTIDAIIDGTELVIGGDILLDFGGISFDTLNFRSLINEKLDGFDSGETIPITILRHGKIGVIEFKKD